MRSSASRSCPLDEGVRSGKTTRGCREIMRHPVAGNFLICWEANLSTDRISNLFNDVECFTDFLRAVDYRGTVNKTRNGTTCQKWTSQTPHNHQQLQEHPTKGLGDHNFCRNPDGGNWAWCYTTDPLVNYEYCEIGSAQPTCDGIECFTDYLWAVDYRGYVNETVNGRTCQKWTSQTPWDHTQLQDYPNVGLGDHNFCRNPDGGDWAWCYTTDPSVRYEYCDIGRAQPTCG
ncbi:plasminogen-like [Diadema setosum]|uniref:plasminogen-like n=1 Tax=Diadema setosum TaxID=31175 RepID=UPI003B3BEA0D